MLDDVICNNSNQIVTVMLRTGSLNMSLINLDLLFNAITSVVDPNSFIKNKLQRNETVPPQPTGSKPTQFLLTPPLQQYRLMPLSSIKEPEHLYLNKSMALLKTCINYSCTQRFPLNCD